MRKTKNNLFIVKEAKSKVQLSRDLALMVRNKSKLLKKPIAWFQFAKKDQERWIFLEHKERQWEILNSIVSEVSSKYKDYTEGQISDILSELVNTQVINVIQEIVSRDEISRTPKDTRYSHLFLIEITTSKYYVPRHPWLRFVSKRSAHVWVVRDIIKKQKFTVYRTTSRDWWIYSSYKNTLKTKVL